PRTFARPAYGLHGTCRRGDPNVELPNVRSLVALMEHAREENPNVEPSVRSTRSWLSWSTPDGNPSLEPPSVRSARLWLSWSTPDGNPSVEPPSVRSARLWLSWSTPLYGRFLSDLRISRLSEDYLKKEITLCRAGAGRTILASDGRPTGFAGNSHGVYLRLSEPVFGYGRIGKFSLSWSKPVASRS